MTSQRHFNIVGGGLSGALLAILLARRGYAVDVYERRPDPRLQELDAGRSINLALAARGFAALQAADVLPRLQALLVPMRGRMIHEAGQADQLLMYGSRPQEVIWSVSRSALNRALIEAAADCPGVSWHFNAACTGVDFAADRLHLAGGPGQPARWIALGATIATDGAGSVLRHALVAAGHSSAREDLLDHDYKELDIPAIDGKPALDPNALHIWPRGGFMLIALPNPDHSFTATLFLAKQGSPGFAALRERGAVQAFFSDYFADTTALMPDQSGQFLRSPQGILGTVHCQGWHLGGRLLLLGDAAHAIVPFHGQGANCAFEDCLEFARLLDRHGRPASRDMAQPFAEIERLRRPNAEAIAQMALENYTEMRDTVRDERFARLKTLSLLLEQRHPQRFIPRYSMVMFHAEIPYAEALRRGALQQQILDEVDRLGAASLASLALADKLIAERLPPLVAEP